MAGSSIVPNFNVPPSASPLVTGGIPSLGSLANMPLQQIPITPSTPEAMQGQAETVAGAPAAYVQGVGSDTAGVVTPSSVSRRNTELGMPNEEGNVNDPTSIMGALKLRNQRAADTYVENLKRNVGLMAPEIQSEGENQVASNLGAVGQIQAQNYGILTQQALNVDRVNAFEQSLVNQVLGSILGLGMGVGLGAAIK